MYDHLIKDIIEQSNYLQIAKLCNSSASFKQYCEKNLNSIFTNLVEKDFGIINLKSPQDFKLFLHIIDYKGKLEVKNMKQIYYALKYLEKNYKYFAPHAWNPDYKKLYHDVLFYHLKLHEKFGSQVYDSKRKISHMEKFVQCVEKYHQQVNTLGFKSGLPHYIEYHYKKLSS